MNKPFFITLCTFFLLTANTFAQLAPKPYGPIPSERQLHWQETEMYCIIHFSMATFKDKEWGYGDEDLQTFNPSDFSAIQILTAAKSAGIKGTVIVAKHHDGFCLWPTKTTDHNIANSPYKQGHGDIVKEYQLAAKKLGLKLGIYCSPWDRNNALYGKPEYVTDIYRKQLKELYSNYGKLFISWHDGANGGDGYYGGAREPRKIDKQTYYGWSDTWAITRAMQPDAVIFGDAGPDVRWVGDEDGVAGETCWETFTPHAAEGTIPSNGNVKYWESINGTRNGDQWIPAECDVPMRAGWFYHQSQDGQSKTPYQLLDLYYKSVGRGACLDLGLSPDKTGRLTREDVNDLREFGSILKSTFSNNLAIGATLVPSNIRGGNVKAYGPKKLLDNDRYSYWATDDAVHNATITLDLHKPTTFNVIRLRENIKLGQRIDSVQVEAYEEGNWVNIARATSIGANRLIRLKENTTAQKVRVKIYAPVAIALSDIGLFKEPTHLTTPEITRDKNGEVHISTEAPVESIYYTLDGSEPGKQALKYSGPVMLRNGGIVKAVSYENNLHSEIANHVFGTSKSDWKIIYVTIKSGVKDAGNAIDENERTIWNSNDSSSFPQEIAIDMGSMHPISAFTYLPRQDKQKDGIVDSYAFYTSQDGVKWVLATEGEFANIKSNPMEQLVVLKTPVMARYFKFSAKHVVSGKNVTIAELGIRQ